jgi:hypothetical protein
MCRYGGGRNMDAPRRGIPAEKEPPMTITVFIRYQLDPALDSRCTNKAGDEYCLHCKPPRHEAPFRGRDSTTFGKSTFWQRLLSGLKISFHLKARNYVFGANALGKLRVLSGQA